MSRDAFWGPSVMKILHLISSGGLYGAERVAIELCKSLKLYGCQSMIGVIKNSHNPHVEVAEEAKKNSIETVVFPCSSQLDLKLISRIRDYIENDKIDLINCHGYKSNFYGLLASRKRIPIVTTNHNWLTSHWKLRIYCFLDSLWIRYFDRIIAVSDGIKEEMIKYKVPKDKIRVIDNGIDMARFNEVISPASIKEEFDIRGDVQIIGTVGNLGYEKGQIYLLQAAKEVIQTFKFAKFLFVGDGPLKAYLENETIKLGIRNNVIFTGYRPDIPRLLSIMDIFVLPSVKEGLPMVILEAMAAKKPVIATRVGAIPKVINDENGILVEPKDVNGIQRAIINLLQNSEKSQKYALTGYEKVKTEYSSASMTSKYYELYKEVLA